MCVCVRLWMCGIIQVLILTERAENNCIWWGKFLMKKPNVIRQIDETPIIEWWSCVEPNTKFNRRELKLLLPRNYHNWFGLSKDANGRKNMGFRLSIFGIITNKPVIFRCTSQMRYIFKKSPYHVFRKSMKLSDGSRSNHSEWTGKEANIFQSNIVHRNIEPYDNPHNPKYQSSSSMIELNIIVQLWMQHAHISEWNFPISFLI